MDLVNQLVSQLGVSQEQAKGGAGLLFNLARERLDGGQFGELAQHVDGMDEMLAAAPSTGGPSGGLMGMLGGLASNLGGGKLEQFGELAELAGGFKSLDLDPSMVQKFVPVVVDFLQQKGGAGVVEMIQGVLGGQR